VKYPSASLALLFILLSGCVTPPFDPRSDVRITSVFEFGTGEDELSPIRAATSATAGATQQAPSYRPAVIEFALNNGVGVTVREIDIEYSPTEGSEIVFQDQNGVIQSGIPPKKSRVQRRFAATIPFTELAQSGVVVQGPANVGTGTSRTCCLRLSLVTQQAFNVLSVDGDFDTIPNLNSDIIADITVRGIDDNDNPFSRTAAITITAIPKTDTGVVTDNCDPACSIGPQPTGAAGGGTEATAATATGG
jgi:hypothetical protein